jgi:hypothetical protein
MSNKSGHDRKRASRRKRETVYIAVWPNDKPVYGSMSDSVAGSLARVGGFLSPAVMKTLRVRKAVISYAGDYK